MKQSLESMAEKDRVKADEILEGFSALSENGDEFNGILLRSILRKCDVTMADLGKLLKLSDQGYQKNFPYPLPPAVGVNPCSSIDDLFSVVVPPKPGASYKAAMQYRTMSSDLRMAIQELRNAKTF